MSLHWFCSENLITFYFCSSANKGPDRHVHQEGERDLRTVSKTGTVRPVRSEQLAETLAGPTSGCAQFPRNDRLERVLFQDAGRGAFTVLFSDMC